MISKATRYLSVLGAIRCCSQDTQWFGWYSAIQSKTFSADRRLGFFIHPWNNLYIPQYHPKTAIFIKYSLPGYKIRNWFIEWIYVDLISSVMMQQYSKKLKKCIIIVAVLPDFQCFMKNECHNERYTTIIMYHILPYMYSDIGEAMGIRNKKVRNPGCEWIVSQMAKFMGP